MNLMRQEADPPPAAAESTPDRQPTPRLATEIARIEAMIAALSADTDTLATLNRHRLQEMLCDKLQMLRADQGAADRR